MIACIDSHSDQVIKLNCTVNYAQLAAGICRKFMKNSVGVSEQTDDMDLHIACCDQRSYCRFQSNRPLEGRQRSNCGLLI